MKKIILSYIAVILGVISVNATSPSDKYLNLMGRADSAIAKSNWTEAIDALNSAMRLEPDNPLNVLLLSNSGMVHHYAGNDSMALEMLSIAHDMAPTSVTVLRNRAKVNTYAGLINNAIDDYDKILKLDTTLVEPLFYHAMLNMDIGNLPQATTDIELMKSRHPYHTSTALAEATLCVISGQYAEAIPLLSTVIKERATAADLSTRAICYLMTSKLPEAADDISAGLKLDPENGELYLYRAMLNKMRFRPDDAKSDAQKAIQLGISPARIKAVGL